MEFLEDIDEFTVTTKVSITLGAMMVISTMIYGYKFKPWSDMQLDFMVGITLLHGLVALFSIPIWENMIRGKVFSTDPIAILIYSSVSIFITITAIVADAGDLWTEFSMQTFMPAAILFVVVLISWIRPGFLNVFSIEIGTGQEYCSPIGEKVTLGGRLGQVVLVLLVLIVAWALVLVAGQIKQQNESINAVRLENAMQKAEIIKAIKEGDENLSQDIAQVLNDQGHSSAEIALVLASQQATANDIAEILKAQDKSAKDIADALKIVGVTSQDIATLLKSQEASALDIAQILASQGTSAENVAEILRNLGEREADIQAILAQLKTQEGYGQKLDEILSTLKSLGTQQPPPAAPKP